MLEDFSVAVEKQGEVICEWATYAEMQEDEKPELRPSVSPYALRLGKATCRPRGLTRVVTEGKTDFAIKKGEVTPVSILCKLANAKLKIEYTIVLKNTLLLIRLRFLPERGIPWNISREKNALRASAPGKLAVNVAVKKAGQAADAVYKVKEIMPRHSMPIR